VDVFVQFLTLPTDSVDYARSFIAKLGVFLVVRPQRLSLSDVVASTRSRIAKITFTLADDATDIQGGSYESVCAERVLESLRTATAAELFAAGLGNVTHLSTPALNSRCSISGGDVQLVATPGLAQSGSSAQSDLWLVLVAAGGSTVALIAIAVIATVVYRNHKIVQARLADGAPIGDVFLVFTDIQSSTELWDHMEDVFRQCLAMHDELQRALIEACGGYEVKTEGDAFLVAFHTGEDAVRFALQLQVELLRLDWPEELLAHPSCEPVEHPHNSSGWIYRGVRVRVGVHAGSDYGDDPNLECRRNQRTLRMDYHGRAINRCGRIQGLAPGGAIVVTSEVIADLELSDSKLIRRTNFTDDDLDRVASAADESTLGVFSNLGMFRLRELNSDTAVFAVLPLEIAHRPLPDPRHIPGFRDPETGAYVGSADVALMHVNPLALGDKSPRVGKAKQLQRLQSPGNLFGNRPSTSGSRGSRGSTDSRSPRPMPRSGFAWTLESGSDDGR
jgi:class 3 adenylate cyclase